MGDKKFSGRSALEALFGAIKSSLSSKQNQTLSTTIAGSSTVEGALQALEQSYSGLDYSELNNKPQINGVELSGNKTASDLGITIPTNLSDLNDDSTHRTVSDTEKSAWNGKATTTDITNAINTLDVSSVGGTGKYISAISETDGKISATEETMDITPTANSVKPVTSGGVKTAIDDSVSLKTATGNPIILTDAANADAEELLMNIEPIQSGSGDPSPTNVRPISGLTEGKVFDYGENLVDITKLTSIKDERGISFTLNGDGSVTANGTAAGRCQIYWVIPNNLATKFAGKILSGNLSINNCSLILELDGSPFTEYARDNGEGSVISNDIASAPESQGVCLIWRIMPGVTLDNVTITPRISDTNTATITFGQTVYGGSVNFKTGEVTVTHGAVDMGSLTWTYHPVSESYSEFFDTILPNDSILGDAALAANIISPLYQTIPSENIAKDGYDNGVQALARDSRRFITCDKRFSDATTYTSALAGNILVYELATPTTLTLTPAELELLKGNNTITANGAEISIEYYPDNAIGALAGRVDDVQAQLATKANITYVDNAINSVIKHFAGEKSITIPLSNSWTVAIFGTISTTPISAILTVVTGGTVSVTDLTSNSIESRVDISANVSNKTITLTSKNTDGFFVNIIY